MTIGYHRTKFKNHRTQWYMEKTIDHSIVLKNSIASQYLVEAFNSFPTVSAGSDQDVIKSRGRPPSLEKELWVEILSSGIGSTELEDPPTRPTGCGSPPSQIWWPTEGSSGLKWLRASWFCAVCPSLTTPRMYSMEGQQRCHHHRCQHHHHHPRPNHHLG